MCGNPRKHFKNSKAGMKTSEIRKMVDGKLWRDHVK
ncbi:hypothetical protein bas34_0103 [Escherichia phage SelmaRatti]|uniref:Uncharacterized protein n=1 Tax=Escherichia phage SelmaRatti TaxID=2852006 RepID=A0AAE7VYB2_9CAUD|nr:hypothetical protein bas34_0103 [Escherichia phage SelmaRatti]